MADTAIPSLAGKVSIITGGASGIGRATALLFARAAASVVIADLNEAGGREVEQEILSAGGKCIFERADVTSDTDCRRVVERVCQAFGGINILFNNAGIIRRASVLELSEEDWDQVMAVNVKAIFLMSRRVIPVMVRGGGGSIINTASGWGLAGGPKAAVYCASKGAVVLLTKAMAVDHGAANIRVNCICPGITDTPMFRFHINTTADPERALRERFNRIPLGHSLSPMEIANAILYLSSDHSSGITGTSLVVDAGYTAASEWSSVR